MVESTIGLAQTALNVAYTFVHGLLTLLYDTVESFASFLGASVHFVLSEFFVSFADMTVLTPANIAVLLLLIVGYLVYARNTQAARRGEKKVA